MSSGGTAGRYDFHAGAWLRQTPAFTCGRQRGLTATHYLYKLYQLYLLYVELRLLLELETALLVVGEGVKQRSYLDPCLRCVFAPLMTKSSRTFDPTAVLTPCTWGLTVSKESR